MQYLYDEGAGKATLELSGDSHRYLFRVRRHRAGESLHLRNLKDQILYRYRIETIDKKKALLLLEEQREYRLESARRIHIGWCLIDPGRIEKALPSLNEIGVAKISFIYCRRSQKTFRPDFERMRKILLNSSQQCGRSVMMELERVESLKIFLARNPESWMLNFSEKNISDQKEAIETILVGAEGGFDEEESAMIDHERIVGVNTPLILRSETAVAAAAAALLLS